MNSNGYALEIRDLARKYGKYCAVDGLNLNVQAGRLRIFRPQWCRQDYDH
jgi:hypothetical protein